MTQTPSRRRARLTVAVGLVATVLALAVAPVSAATGDVADKAGDVTSGVDLHKVRVVNDARVRVRLWHENLTREGNQGASVYFDTDRSRPGPEFGFFTGLNDGSDYGMTRVRNWEQVGGMLDCFYDLDLDYARDTTLVRVGRACLDTAGRVRVAVKVGDYREPEGANVRDWLVKRRHLTSWVPRG